MKKYRKSSIKILSVVLMVAMLIMQIPMTVFAEEILHESNEMSECHPLHDENCGYTHAVEDVLCTHECDICQPKENKESVGKCTCNPIPANEDGHISTDCPLYEFEGVDLAKNEGKTVTSFAENRMITKRTASLSLQSIIITDNNGTEVVPVDGVYDMLGSEGWKWDKNKNILTLSGANFDVSDNVALYLVPDVTIELIGENSITDTWTSAIHVYGNSVTIKGSGTLNVNATQGACIVADAGSNSSPDIIIESGTLELVSGIDGAIFTPGNIIVSGGNITATSYYPGLNATEGINISDATVVVKSSNDSAIFTKGALTISDSAKITVVDSLYSGINAKGNITITDSTVSTSGGTNINTGSSYTAIYTPEILTINGKSKVTAKGDWRGMEAETALLITGNAEVRATGSNSGLQSKDITIFENAVVEATSTASSGIAGQNSISIIENAEVTATGAQAGIVSNGSMNLSAKNIKATGGWYGVDNEGVNASGITIGGKLTAVATGGHGIYGTKSIIGDDKADIMATGTMNGILVVDNIIFTNSKVEAIGNGGNGISTKGKITFDGGAVHAKGASTYAAIRTENEQTGSETAESKISLTNLIEKNGGKVAFCDWVSDNGKMISWSTFIAKDDDRLTTTFKGGFTNGLLEVWLAAPHTVTFDMNGGSGMNFTNKVYPGNNVLAPTTDPTKDGHHFSGWYLDNTKFDFENMTITEDITLKAKFAAHTPTKDDGDCTTAIKCSVCGMETTPAKTHIISDWLSDALNHWKECIKTDCTHTELSTVHTYGKWVIDKDATETETGSKHRDCSVCGHREVVTIPVVPHTHAPSLEWSKDTNNHWHNCIANDGERMDEAAHKWNIGVITTPATITQDGVKTFTCTVCQQTKTEIMHKLPSNGALADNSTGIKVEYEDGSVFDSGIILRVTSKPQEEMDTFKNFVDKAAAGLTLGGLYDVKLLKDGVAIQPDGKIKISITLTDAIKSMTNLQIVYIDDAGNVTIIPSETKGGMITFFTDHFSHYGVIGKVKSSDTGGKNSNSGSIDSSQMKDNSPQTGDSSAALLFTHGMFASATALVILNKKRKVLKLLKK